MNASMEANGSGDRGMEPLLPFFVLRTEYGALLYLSKEQESMLANALHTYHEIDTLCKGTIEDNDEQHYLVESIKEILLGDAKDAFEQIDMKWFEIQGAEEGIWLPKEVITFFTTRVFGYSIASGMMVEQIWRSGMRNRD